MNKRLRIWRNVTLLISCSSTSEHPSQDAKYVDKTVGMILKTYQTLVNYKLKHSGKSVDVLAHLLTMF